VDNYLYFETYVTFPEVTQIGQEVAAAAQHLVISRGGQLTWKENTLSVVYQSLIDRIAVVSHTKQ